MESPTHINDTTHTGELKAIVGEQVIFSGVSLSYSLIYADGEVGRGPNSKTKYPIYDIVRSLKYPKSLDHKTTYPTEIIQLANYSSIVSFQRTKRVSSRAVRRAPARAP